MARSSRGSYRSTHCALPDSPEFQSLTPHSKLTWLILKHHRINNFAGIFVYYQEALVAGTGLTPQQLQKCMEELEATDWLRREGTVVWLRNVLRFTPGYNLSDPLKVTGVHNVLLGLPKVGLVNEFCRYYGIPEVHNKESLSKASTQKPEKPKKSTPKPSAQVRLVYEFWREGFGHTRAILTPKRAKLVQALLTSGYSELDLAQAIIGNSRSVWHIENKVHELEIICRDGEHIEKAHKEVDSGEAERIFEGWKAQRGAVTAPDGADPEGGADAPGDPLPDGSGSPGQRGGDDLPEKGPDGADPGDPGGVSEGLCPAADRLAEGDNS